MKKFLLSFAAIGCALLSNAQILMNEFYVRPNPNPGHHEYFELKNFGSLPENADCYTLVTYFENETTGEEGVYVVDMPAFTVAGRGFLTASSQAPSFVYQNGTGTADFSWNDGNINRYVKTGGSLVLNNAGAPYANIFVKSNGLATNGQNGLYAFFLFKSGVLVDALLGAHNSTTVPSYITQLGTLNHASGCGSIAYNFATINSTSAGIIANVNAEAGTDNGYHRVGGDCTNAGPWQKASSVHEHTPGAPNHGQNNGNPDASYMLQADAMCIDNVTVEYDITAGHNSLFPVTVSLYWDANGSQFLDSGDVFIGSQVDGSVNDPAKRFTHPSGQEDFIFVFDAAGGCYDTMMPLNCPAAIILPVTWKSFQATRERENVVLNWITATEINNRGFDVQRMIANGTWESVAFVSTKAPDGKSNNDIAYSYTDNNPFRGITQYRLQQVDTDGKFKYSEVRAVRGSGNEAGGVRLFPNPSNGNATLVFENVSSSHDVFITDMAGRAIKQFRGVTDNSLKISNLTPGVYAIRIIDQRTGSQSNERLVVSGR